ncbi:hypothetical protein HanXRQr2_Chr16g0767581 [Helianthus annuus]|uniref:Uncharacterized protein n=1 Tax=Helianthus annuus TaxID=4232 RepID=A0A9K3DUI3_HELAN|nr:hypothetical protein HanXRQr2_Chr16g0767581 [Helianthus annuus]KAJ0822753.1 hypothetical protein HanPSC8_Chr16g0735761 [Helianthus annuus]
MRDLIYIKVFLSSSEGSCGICIHGSWRLLIMVMKGYLLGRN